jgi:hypothetical protein
VRLAELGVVPASALGAVGQGADRRLSVLAELAGPLPGGLARGSTVAVTAQGPWATSLLLALLVRAGGRSTSYSFGVSMPSELWRHCRLWKISR